EVLQDERRGEAARLDQASLRVPGLHRDELLPGGESQADAVGPIGPPRRGPARTGPAVASHDRGSGPSSGAREARRARIGPLRRRVGGWRSRSRSNVSPAASGNTALSTM